MQGDAVEKIKELAVQGMELKEIDGKMYSPEKLHRVYSDPRPAKIEIKSLSGIVDYLNSNIDNLNTEKLILHIVDHSHVRILTNIHGEENERHTVIYAKLEDVERFPFNQWIGQEQFIIKCRSMFEDTKDLAEIIKYTAKIDQESTVVTEDDGITQIANIKQGISGVKTARKDIPSLVFLSPYRTFMEADQPPSQFLFRMKTIEGKASCALYDADGGMWKNQARENIKKYFSGKINIPIIA